MSKIKDEHKINHRGNPNYVTYPGFLDAAHREGLKEIDTSLLQVPTNDNGGVAIVKATVVTEKGTFSGLGDANTKEKGAAGGAPIRMAETRAKRRALSDAVNAGIEDEEEIDPEANPVQGPDPTPSGNVSDLRREQGGQPRGGGTEKKARKSQRDLLKQLAAELRGEGGVERLVARIGKPLEELTVSEADEWIDRLTPADGQS